MNMRYLIYTATILVLILIASCAKDTNDNKANNILSSDRYLLAMVNGDSLLIQDGVGGFVNKVGTGGGVIDTNGTYLVRQFTEYGNGTDTLRIYIIELFGSEPSESQKEAVVHVGSYDYGAGFGSIIPQGGAQNGVVITFKNSGAWWSTEGHTQTGSFTIDSLTSNTNNSSKYVFDGSFGCTLFNNNGDSLVVSNASFSALVIPQ